MLISVYLNDWHISKVTIFCNMRLFSEWYYHEWLQLPNNSSLIQCCPGLFLGDGSDSKKLSFMISDDMEIVAYAVLSDGKNDWIIGLVKPKWCLYSLQIHWLINY